MTTGLPLLRDTPSTVPSCSAPEIRSCAFSRDEVDCWDVWLLPEALPRCKERIDALLTAATLMRSFGLTLWTFWQNAGQMQIYGSQANTLVDNAAVIQAFGVRNRRMAVDFANLIGNVSADEKMALPPDHQMLLIEGTLTQCRQFRYYEESAGLGKS
jgi:hypothetical protein